MKMQGFVCAGTDKQYMAMDDIATILEMVSEGAALTKIAFDNIIIQNALRPLRSTASIQESATPGATSAALASHNVRLLLPLFIAAHKTICAQVDGVLRSHANETRNLTVAYGMSLYHSANKLMTVMVAASNAKRDVVIGVEYAN